MPDLLFTVMNFAEAFSAVFYCGFIKREMKVEKETLAIEWLRLLDGDKPTCPRFGSTEQEVEKAMKELNRLLASIGAAAALVFTRKQPETAGGLCAENRIRKLSKQGG